VPGNVRGIRAPDILAKVPGGGGISGQNQLWLMPGLMVVPIFIAFLGGEGVGMGGGGGCWWGVECGGVGRVNKGGGSKGGGISGVREREGGAGGGRIGGV